MAPVLYSEFQSGTDVLSAPLSAPQQKASLWSGPKGIACLVGRLWVIYLLDVRDAATFLGIRRRNILKVLHRRCFALTYRTFMLPSNTVETLTFGTGRVTSLVLECSTSYFENSNVEEWSWYYLSLWRILNHSKYLVFVKYWPINLFCWCCLVMLFISIFLVRDIAMDIRWMCIALLYIDPLNGVIFSYTLSGRLLGSYEGIHRNSWPTEWSQI